MAAPRAQMVLLLSIATYGAYLGSIGGTAAPFLAEDFGLDDSAITLVAGIIGLGALGTIVLTRLADRRGRRPILLLSLALTPFVTGLIAVSPSIVAFTSIALVATVFVGVILPGVTVMLNEEVEEGRRAEAMAWFGVVTALIGAVPLLLGSFVTALPGTWRWFWILGALPIVLLPTVRRRLPETRRFAHAEADGRTETSRIRDLFRGVYRRRALGMLACTWLRVIALVAINSWQYYHLLRTLELAGWVAMLVFFAAGPGILVGNPVGARLANRWGRRPTLVFGVLGGVGFGAAFFWVPADFAPTPAVLLAPLFLLQQFCQAAFAVADRCLDSELFPTELRATYAGCQQFNVASSAIVAQLTLSALSSWLGGLVPAITGLTIVVMPFSIAIFLWIAPETKGLSLEEAALELRPSPGEAAATSPRR